MRRVVNKHIFYLKQKQQPVIKIGLMMMLFLFYQFHKTLGKKSKLGLSFAKKPPSVKPNDVMLLSCNDRQVDS